MKDDIAFESVTDALDRIRTGMVINPKTIKLDENDLYYHLHNGAKKSKKGFER